MVKTPWTRILDLTCGWYEFVEGEASREEEPLIDERLSAQELFDLYQSASVQDFEKPENGDFSARSEAEIRAFLNEKILPLLLRQ